MARFEPGAAAEGPSGDVRVVVMMLAAQSQALAVMLTHTIKNAYTCIHVMRIHCTYMHKVNAYTACPTHTDRSSHPICTYSRHTYF